MTVERLVEVKAALIKEASGTDSEKEAEAIRKLKRMVAIRLGNVDLDLDCAVCVTLDYKIAGLYPFDPQKPEVMAKPARVYVVRMKGWLETYNVQAGLAPELAYSKEVASLGVPWDDILGCVLVNRTVCSDGRTVTLRKAGTELRPGADEADFKEVVATLPDVETTPVPDQKTADSKMSVDEKFAHLITAVESLTGAPKKGDSPALSPNHLRFTTAQALAPYSVKGGKKPVV